MEKFVIIPERAESNLFKLLPLLYLVKENFENPEVNIVHTNNLESQLSTFPMKVKFFHVNESDFGARASVKLAAKLDDLFNITHILTYREDVGVLQFIKALKGKNRVGWKSLVNDVFLTDSVPKNNVGNTYLNLFRGSKTFKENSKKVDDIVSRFEVNLPENFFKDSSSSPFFFISCGNFSEDTFVSNFSRQLVESLEDNRLIVWSKEESELLKEFSANNENVVDASSADESQIFHYISRCQTFLSTIEWHCHLACFLGVEPYFISENLPFPISELKYSPHFLKKEGENSLQLLDSKGQRSLDTDQLVNLVLQENDL